MKILHVISSGGMYGAEAVILNLSAELNDSGSHVSYLGVFSHDAQKTPQLHEVACAAGLNSELIPCRGQLDLSVPRSLRALAQRLEADVVHAHGYKADIYAFLAFRGRDRPALVSTCHTWYDNDTAVRLYGAADRWVLRHFDEVIAVSPEVQQRLWRAGVSKARVNLIRNGIDVRPFASATEERIEPDAQGTKLKVGLVGRLAPEKGVDVFLRAVARLAGEAPHVEFLVAGDGPERPALETLLTELGLKENVRLLGEQKSMAAFYASLDVLVSASRQEGLPMALLEGMASGLPVVATLVGAVPQIVVEGETGLLVPPDSPEALSVAIKRLLGDQQIRTNLGRAGRGRVISEFSAGRMTAEYLDVYRNALARRSVPHSVPQQSNA